MDTRSKMLVCDRLELVPGRNQGPTKLDRCDIDSYIPAGGLRGTCRLRSLTQNISSNQDFLPITRALRENKGLVDLHFWHEYDFCISDETWDAVCDSLKTHPTLKLLRLGPKHAAVGGALLAPAVLTYRIQALVNILKVHTIVQRIYVGPKCYSEHELYRGSVIPYLETNRFQPRLLAIQKTRPIMHRAKVLRQAILAD
jgi:hypothetical protein